MDSPAVRSLHRDPEDYEIEPPAAPLPTSIPAFEALFSEVVQELNLVIGYNNTLHDCMMDIKETASTVVGAWRVELSVAPNIDLLLLRVVLQGTKAAPERQQAQAILENNSTACRCDQLVAEARLCLQEALLDNPSARLSLDSQGGLLCSSPDIKEVVTTFTDALSDLNAALRPEGCEVEMVLRPAAAHGSTTVYYSVVKPVLKAQDEDEVFFDPVTLLDIAASASASSFHVGALIINNLVIFFTCSIFKL